MSKLSDSLEKAIKAVEDSPVKLNQGPTLSPTDLTEIAKKYLSGKAQQALSKKSRCQVIQVPGSMEVFVSVYLCARVNSGNEEVGVEKLARILNDFAGRGLIHSCLAPMSYLQLAQVPMQNDQSMVFCFPLIPAHRQEEAKAIAKDFMACEGGTGPCIDPSDKELPEGQFYANVGVTHVMTAIVNRSVDTILKEEIDTYLRVLPKGTEIVSVKRCTVMSLSVPFEVIFFNPLLKSIKLVDLNHMRMCEVVDGKVEQFNLLLSIEYTKRDGSKL